jgi:hypothetical protein
MIPLTPEIVRTIQSSCRPLIDQEPKFFQEFHLSLAELMPEVAVMRAPAGEQISRSMVGCVLWAVFAEEQPGVVEATLQGVGLEAHRLGFPRAGYQSVGHALLRSVRAGYYGDWSGNLSSSWIAYHGWLCEHWLHGADTGLFEDRAQPQVGPEPDEDDPFAPPVELREPGRDVELDDEEEPEEGLSYGEIMVSMTQRSNRPSRWRGRKKRPVEDEDA